MKTHTIKILEDKGDCVRFLVVDKFGVKVKHPLCGGDKYTYEITYVLNGFGLKNGYVVFGIRRRSDERNQAIV